MEADRVRTAMVHLTEDQRDVLIRRFVLDQSLEDVASTTKRTVGAVKSMQHRALEVAAPGAQPEEGGMTDWIDPQLSASLDAWRLSSRRAPRRHARERAQDAMLDAMIVASRRPRARSFFGLRPRFGRAGLIASMATIVAATSVAAAGWNAPPGSALFLVREARQGVMLKLPGADDATLHLQFAESSLGDAREGINPRPEPCGRRHGAQGRIHGTFHDPSSPLWPRYRLDEATLLSEESGIESESPSPLPIGTPRPTEDGNPPSGANPAKGDGGESPSRRVATAAPHRPRPTGTTAVALTLSPSPGQTPPPDD